MIRAPYLALPLILATVASRPASAQRAGAPGGAPVIAPTEARQFDFLLGEWQLDVRPKATGLAQRIHGTPKLAGTWKAWRAFDGWGIEDEFRVTDAGGNLQAMSHVLRIFDPNTARWNQMALDVLRQRFAPSNAQWRDGEMVITAQATDEAGKAVLARVRFFDITPTAFRQEQARSYDGGKTWEAPHITIIATRTGATAGR